MPTSILHIDVQALAANYRWFQSQAGARTVNAVVKSNAYGHGLAATVRALDAVGCRHYAVFSVAEAAAVRCAGGNGRVLVLGGAAPGDYETAVALQLTLACHDLDSAAELERCAAARQTTCSLHLKVDTGMGRLGFLPEAVPAALQALAGMPHLRLSGCFSHLAVADQPQHPLTQRQIDRFRQVLPLLPPECRDHHLCATAGFLNRLAPELPGIRIGLGLYGYGGDGLKPAMSLRSRIMAVKTLPAGSSISYGATHVLTRPSRIAVIPVGYADGYPRCLGGQGELLIDGRRAPIVGRVCMGMCMADVTPWPEVAAGHEAVLLGAQRNERIDAEELAAKAGTIPYEILCALGGQTGGTGGATLTTETSS